MAAESTRLTDEEEAQLRKNVDPQLAFIQEQIRFHGPMNGTARWQSFEALRKTLERLATRGAHPDDRALGVTAIRHLTGLWLSPGDIDDLPERKTTPID